MSDDRIIIPADVAAKLEMIPNTGRRATKSWHPWQDKILLDYWESKDKRALAKLIGRSETSCRNRYRELSGG